jgi:hypothetical protein
MLNTHISHCESLCSVTITIERTVSKYDPKRKNGGHYQMLVIGVLRIYH